MAEKLETLVIEDTPEFREVAERVYSKKLDLNCTYVSNYHEAIDYLDNHRVDQVISDLFFPSQIDFTKKLFEESESATREFKELEGIWEIENARKMTFNAIDSRRPYELFTSLSQNPSGIAIALYCMERKIPYSIISQGDRHKGDLGIVRYALAGMPQIVLKTKSSTGNYEIDLDGSDKTKERAWEYALERLKFVEYK